MKKKTWLVLAFLLWAQLPALASAGSEIPPELAEYISLPSHNLSTGGIVGQQASQLPPCKSNTARLAAVSVYSPVSFDGAKRNPVKGIWKESWKVDGCDVTGVFNVLVVVGGPGKLQFAPLPPGQSLADPILQKSAAIHAATSAVKLGAADCQGSRIIDTRFVAFEGAEPVATQEEKPQVIGADGKSDIAPVMAQKLSRPWSEEWTVDVCGVQVFSVVHFAPGLTGTAVKAIPEEARRK
jgi:hypothetical protein